MNSKRKTPRRIDLGRVSTATLGSQFKTIEQVGLQGTSAGITDR
jgi:hypothetical protein